MQILDIRTFLEVYDHSRELSEAEQQLLQQARQATESAYAPYSHFRVGAALLLEDGTCVKGSNQENAAYPSGLCAERTVIFWTGANHPGKKIRSIAVVACQEGDPDCLLPASPCGACRQALIEYENQQGSPIRLLLCDQEGRVIVSPSIANLLPLQFNDKVLQRKPAMG